LATHYKLDGCCCWAAVTLTAISTPDIYTFAVCTVLQPDTHSVIG